MAPAPLEELAAKEYLGRIIILGRDKTGTHTVVVYALTGRGRPSQARRIERRNDDLHVVETDLAAVQGGIPSLLLYPCIQRLDDTLVVSNGRQTDLLYTTTRSLERQERDPREILRRAFDQPCLVPGRDGAMIDLASFEPDPPTYTPRISAVVAPSHAVLHAIARVHNGTAQQYFMPHYFEWRKGIGSFLSTYAGKNVPAREPLPAARYGLQQLPVVRIAGTTPDDVARDVYDALGPQQPETRDFRVSVAAYFLDVKTGEVTTSIKNRDAL